ncbi:hypothetical protein CAEBREN_31768 [Caenorhabditis brenneri]|uniref:Uncharacterized protein n=1 Tax=Caenorhabditis brenneri TaxID=135651 RepID=G0NXR2_CAEBE|nr:hypothetical protein CAEBREN_32456 [Caenorhabditis brenneri]EGT39664.1 hypothetical protein CAEBREN_31768 [Caenorhabditis brenneri]
MDNTGEGSSDSSGTWERISDNSQPRFVWFLYFSSQIFTLFYSLFFFALDSAHIDRAASQKA